MSAKIIPILNKNEAQAVISDRQADVLDRTARLSAKCREDAAKAGVKIKDQLVPFNPFFSILFAGCLFIASCCTAQADAIDDAAEKGMADIVRMHSINEDGSHKYDRHGRYIAQSPCETVRPIDGRCPAIVIASSSDEREFMAAVAQINKGERYVGR